MATFAESSEKMAAQSNATKLRITSSSASGVMTTFLRPRDSFELAGSLQGKIYLLPIAKVLQKLGACPSAAAPSLGYSDSYQSGVYNVNPTEVQRL